MVVTGLLIQWLALTPVYLYTGVGYFPAAGLSSTERQSSIYFDNFIEQTLQKKSWLMEFAPT